MPKVARKKSSVVGTFSSVPTMASSWPKFVPAKTTLPPPPPGGAITITTTYPGGLAQAINDARTNGVTQIWLDNTSGSGAYPFVALSAFAGESSSSPLLTIQPVVGKETLISVNGYSESDRWNIFFKNIYWGAAPSSVHTAVTLYGFNQIQANTPVGSSWGVVNNNLTFTPKTTSGVWPSIRYVYKRTPSLTKAISVVGRDITIFLGTAATSSGVQGPTPTTTANEIKALIEGNAAANALVTVTLGVNHDQGWNPSIGRALIPDSPNDGTGICGAIPRQYCRPALAGITAMRGGGHKFDGCICFSLNPGTLNSSVPLQGLQYTNGEIHGTNGLVFTKWSGAHGGASPQLVDDAFIYDVLFQNVDFHGCMANDMFHPDGAERWTFRDCLIHDVTWGEQAAHPDIFQTLTVNSGPGYCKSMWIDRCKIVDVEAQIMLPTGQRVVDWKITNTVAWARDGYWNQGLASQFQNIDGLTVINCSYIQTFRIIDNTCTNVTMFNNVINWLSLDLGGGYTGFVYRDYNVIDNPQFGLTLNAHETGTSPLYHDLGNFDVSLNVGSVGIDGGIASANGYTAPTVDIRGVPRSYGTAPDCGAYEYGDVLQDPAFLPIAVWLQDQNIPVTAPQYAAMGVNIYAGFWNGVTSAKLTTLKNNGIYALPGTGRPSPPPAVLPLTEQSAVAAMTSDLQARVIGWMPYDEPDLPVNGCISPLTLKSTYDSLKGNDPLKRPILINFNQDIVNADPLTAGCFPFQQYAPTCDISSFDIYPCNDSYGIGNPGNGLPYLKEWLGKRTFCFFESTSFESYPCDVPYAAFPICNPHNQKPSRAPTPVETMTEIMHAIIKGCTGIMLFCHANIPPTTSGSQVEAGLLDSSYSTMVAALTTYFAQLKSLAAVINSPLEWAPQATVVANFLVTTASRHFAGKRYIFAANIAGKYALTTATFTVPDIASGTVTVLGENRTLPLSNNQFTDTFGDSGYVDSISANAPLFYGKHIYQI